MLTRWRNDSIVVRDSTVTLIKGDSVVTDRWHYGYRYRQRVDTVYRSFRDSVTIRQPYPVEVVKEVPRKKKWWENVLQWVGGITLAAGAVWVARRLKSTANMV